MLNRFDEVSSHSEGVVHDQRDTVIMGNLKNDGNVNDGAFSSKKIIYLGEDGDVAEDVLGVGNTLNVDGLCLLINCGGKSLRGEFCNPFYADAEFLERHCEFIFRNLIMRWYIVNSTLTFKLVVCLQGQKLSGMV